MLWWRWRWCRWLCCGGSGSGCWADCCLLPLCPAHPSPLSHAASSLWLSNAARTDKVGQMNSEQLQGLAVLALAMVPVALLWWVWIRMLD